MGSQQPPEMRTVAEGIIIGAQVRELNLEKGGYLWSIEKKQGWTGDAGL